MTVYMNTQGYQIISVLKRDRKLCFKKIKQQSIIIFTIPMSIITCNITEYLDSNMFDGMQMHALGHQILRVREYML